MPRSRAVVLASVFVVPLVAALAAGCSKGASTPAARTAAVAPAGDELVVVAVRGGGAFAAGFEGYLEPAVDAVVPARTAGLVQEVYVREGQRVGRGDRLARLEDEEQRLEVEYTGALAEQAAAELDRAEKGAAGQFVSRQSLDAARAKARATRVDLELAKLAYARRTLRAPVAGIVWQVRAETHRQVTPDEILFRVTEPGRLRADLYLPAALVGRIKPGDPVRLTPTSAPSAEPLAGKAGAVSPIVDPATGRFRVVVEVDGGGRALAGQTVEAEFPGIAAGGGSRAGAILPREALVEREADALYVWRVDAGKAHRVAVALGESRPDGFAVLSGVAPGDLVAVRGATPPAEGAAVRTRLASARGD